MERFICLKEPGVVIPREGDIESSSDEDDDDEDGDEDDYDDYNDREYNEEDETETLVGSEIEEKRSKKNKKVHLEVDVREEQEQVLVNIILAELPSEPEPPEEEKVRRPFIHHHSLTTNTNYFI